MQFSLVHRTSVENEEHTEMRKQWSTTEIQLSYSAFSLLCKSDLKKPLPGKLWKRNVIKINSDPTLL